MSTKEKEQTKNVMTEELAILEVEAFLKKWVKRPPSREALGDKYDEKILEEYPETVDALIHGNLTIDADGVPVYKLMHPMKSESGETVRTEVTFKTRVKATDKANIGFGIDLKKELPKYSQLLLCHVIGFTRAELDLLHKFDYSTVSEVASLFL